MASQNPSMEPPPASNSSLARGTSRKQTGGDVSSRDKARLDQRLAERCLAGEDQAWEQFYQRCHPPLLRAIKLLLGQDAGDIHLVDELAARVWYALLRDGGRLLARYDAAQDSDLSAFLMGLARIEIMRYMRAERRRRSHELIGGRKILAEGRVPDWKLASMMDEFTSTLTPPELEFMERFLLDSPGAEADADVEELPATSVWQRRHRLRLKLQTYLDRE
jgi:DNA-directed RNA polymerase specialized sigma24 family protein